MDVDDNLSYVFALQLEELQDGHDEMESADWALAKSLMEDDLRYQRQILLDHLLAVSLDRAEDSNDELDQHEHHAVTNDRASEMQIKEARPDEVAQMPDIDPIKKRRKLSENLSPEVEGRYEALVAELSNVCWKARGSGEGTSTSAAMSSSKTDGRRTVDCDTCWEEMDDFETIRLKCGHKHCPGCLGKSIRIATQQNSFPRCCEIISLQNAAEALTEIELIEYHAFVTSHDTGPRVLCSGEQCGIPLAPSWIRHELGLCLQCDSQTCTICRGPYHRGECPNDADTKSLFEVAENKRWQRCLHCGMIVMLATGCYHITCRCGAQFCYICGAKWKSCHCTHADERVLMGNGQPQMIHQQRSSLRLNPEGWDTQVEALVEEIRAQDRQHTIDQRNELEALQFLRRERIAERSYSRTEQLWKDEEKRVFEESARDARALEWKREQEKYRVEQVKAILTKKFELRIEKIRASGKGKGKAIAVNPENIISTIMEFAAAAELSPQKPSRMNRNSNYKNPTAVPVQPSKQALNVKGSGMSIRHNPSLAYGILRLIGN